MQFTQIITMTIVWQFTITLFIRWFKTGSNMENLSSYQPIKAIEWCIKWSHLILLVQLLSSCICNNISNPCVNTSKLRQNVYYVAKHIFEIHHLTVSSWIWIVISLKYVHKDPKITISQYMLRQWFGTDNSISEPMTLLFTAPYMYTKWMFYRLSRSVLAVATSKLHPLAWGQLSWWVSRWRDNVSKQENIYF